MCFQWIRLNKAGVSKYLLIMRLGDTSTKTIYVDTKLVPQREVSILKGLTPMMSRLSLEERIRLFKEACPDAYRLAFRTALSGQIEVVREYK